MKELFVKYLDNDIPELEYVDGKSDWVDLRAAETVILKKGERKIINLGVAIKLPEGYEAHIAPRSSTYKNFKVLQYNSIGIIDESYCGPNDWWGMPVLAMEDTIINRGDHICQFRIMEHQPKLIFTKVEDLSGEDRGGFGSTGVN